MKNLEKKLENMQHIGKTISTVTLIGGMIAYAMVRTAPTQILNVFGLGYKKRFELADKVIERPEKHNTRAHKKAFEDVGRYVSDALTRDVMISYEDSSLKQESFLRPKKVSMEVWHEVLDHFKEEGLIEERYTLKIPTINWYDGKVSENKYSPKWDKDGNSLDKERAINSPIAGYIPKDGAYDPCLMTKEQKNALVGIEYAMKENENNKKGQHELFKEEVQRHKITKDDFTKVFYRDRRILTEKSCKEGGEKLLKIFKYNR